jgi:hypothetical protein
MRIPVGFGSGKKLPLRVGTGTGRFPPNRDGFGKSFPAGKIPAAILKSDMKSKQLI